MLLSPFPYLLGLLILIVFSRTKEWYGFTDAGMAWLKERGCEWIKLTAEPGDLLLCKLTKQGLGQALTDRI
jgi:hypothetical protein